MADPSSVDGSAAAEPWRRRRYTCRDVKRPLTSTAFRRQSPAGRYPGAARPTAAQAASGPPRLRRRRPSAPGRKVSVTRRPGALSASSSRASCSLATASTRLSPSPLPGVERCGVEPDEALLGPLALVRGDARAGVRDGHGRRRLGRGGDGDGAAGRACTSRRCRRGWRSPAPPAGGDPARRAPGSAPQPQGDAALLGQGLVQLDHVAAPPRRGRAAPSRRAARRPRPARSPAAR